MTAASASSAPRPSPPRPASTRPTGPDVPATMSLTHRRPVLPSVVPAGMAPCPSRRAFRLVALVAALGVLGTLIFGVLYATQSNSSAQNPAVNQSAQAFLTDFFNFNAKTVDADFTAVTNMATGPFATQAKQFFNSSIRQALEKALAESRGQTRALYVQSETAERSHALRRGRPDLREQQDHDTPGRRRPHGDQPGRTWAVPGRSPTSPCSRAPRRRARAQPRGRPAPASRASSRPTDRPTVPFRPPHRPADAARSPGPVRPPDPGPAERRGGLTCAVSRRVAVGCVRVCG